MAGAEFGVVHMPVPGLGAEIASRAEAMGFDLCLYTDSHLLAGDPFAEACLAAAQTSIIRLGTGVTNPVTRSAGVIASAIGTVHVESGGRAVLGLGRGDSAAAQAGLRPASAGRLEACAREVRDHLGESGIGWLAASGLPRVPIDVACTGARSIAAAVRVADRVSFAVGAAPERIAWALAKARAGLAASGRLAGSVRFGAYLNVVVDGDPGRARRHARAGVGLMAHFSAMTARPEAVPERHRQTIAELRAHYDMGRHTRADSRQARLVDEDFIDWFAIAGEASYCLERISQILEMGVGHVYVIGGAENPTPLAVLDGEAILAERVIARLR